MLDGWAGPGLLPSYTSERHPVFASTAADFIETFIRDDRAFLETFSPERDAAAFAEAWARRDEGASAVTAFEPNYEGSPLIPGTSGSPSAQGSHAFTARPGHHLPPARDATGMPISAHLGAGFTLLTFGPDAAPFAKAAAASSIPLTVADIPRSEETDRYAAALILVRPDWFVAWSGSTARRRRRYSCGRRLATRAGAETGFRSKGEAEPATPLSAGFPGPATA